MIDPDDFESIDSGTTVAALAFLIGVFCFGAAIGYAAGWVG